MRWTFREQNINPGLSIKKETGLRQSAFTIKTKLCNNAQNLIQIDSPSKTSKKKRAEQHNVRERRNISLSGCEWRWKGQPPLWPPPRPSGVWNFYEAAPCAKQLDKHCKNIKGGVGPRWQAVPTTVRTEPKHPGEKSNVKRVQTEFMEVPFINKAMSCFLPVSCCRCWLCLHPRSPLKMRPGGFTQREPWIPFAHIKAQIVE